MRKVYLTFDLQAALYRTSVTELFPLLMSVTSDTAGVSVQSSTCKFRSCFQEPSVMSLEFKISINFRLYK